MKTLDSELCSKNGMAGFVSTIMPELTVNDLRCRHHHTGTRLRHAGRLLLGPGCRLQHSPRLDSDCHVPVWLLLATRQRLDGRGSGWVQLRGSGGHDPQGRAVFHRLCLYFIPRGGSRRVRQGEQSLQRGVRVGDDQTLKCATRHSRPRGRDRRGGGRASLRKGAYLVRPDMPVPSNTIGYPAILPRWPALTLALPGVSRVLAFLQGRLARLHHAATMGLHPGVPPVPGVSLPPRFALITVPSTAASVENRRAT